MINLRFNTISNYGILNLLLLTLQKLIDHIKAHSHSCAYASSMPPPVAQQVISSMRLIMGLDGTNQGKPYYAMPSCSSREKHPRKCHPLAPNESLY